MKHTEGKLRAKDKVLISESGDGIAVAEYSINISDKTDLANAQRLVTCWNEHDDLVKERDELVAVIRRVCRLDGKCVYDRFEISQIIETILAKYPEAS